MSIFIALKSLNSTCSAIVPKHHLWEVHSFKLILKWKCSQMFFRKNIPVPLMGGASFVEFDIFAFSANDAAAILRSKYFAIVKTHWMPPDLCVAKMSLKYQNCSILRRRALNFYFCHLKLLLKTHNFMSKTGQLRHDQKQI